jgi:hypothetical protein
MDKNQDPGKTSRIRNTGKRLNIFSLEILTSSKRKNSFFISEANFILPGFGFGSPPVFALIRVQSGYTNICSLPLP